jgi:hypothetical protein
MRCTIGALITQSLPIAKAAAAAVAAVVVATVAAVPAVAAPGAPRHSPLELLL